MRSILLATRLLLVTLAFAALSPTAQAQAIRFISTLGVNANPCTLTQPCRTLQRGIGVTPTGGELRILDSGEYGPGATIAKSITIDGNGNTVMMSGSPAITINSGSAVVSLRDFLLDGRSTADFGILISAAAATHIVGCEIQNFLVGILSDTPGGTELFVTDTASRDNISSGLEVAGYDLTTLTIENSRFENNGILGLVIDDTESKVQNSILAGSQYGLLQRGGRTNIGATIAAQNSIVGFYAESLAAMTLERAVARGNGIGLQVNNNSTARISNSVFTNNGNGINNVGVVETRQNNTVAGNEINVNTPGALVPLPPT